MKKNAYLFVFDGFSDWDTSSALKGLSQSPLRVRTIAVEKNPKTSAGGMVVLPEFDFMPEVDLDDIHESNTGLLLLPGGSAWKEGVNNPIAPLVIHCLENHIPVAAIGEAAILLADLGILDQLQHTGLSPEELMSLTDDYRGEHHHRDVPAVRAGNVITAGLGCEKEFAREIFSFLGIESAEVPSHVVRLSA